MRNILINDVLILRDLCFIVLCFVGFLRFEEAIALKCNNVSFNGSDISLYLEKSKTDQYRQGSEVVISKGASAAYLVKLLHTYIMATYISLESNHYLFKPIYRSKGVCGLIYKNQPISYTRAMGTVVSRLREVCGSANIGIHSMHAGSASMAARQLMNGVGNVTVGGGVRRQKMDMLKIV